MSRAAKMTPQDEVEELLGMKLEPEPEGEAPEPEAAPEAEPEPGGEGVTPSPEPEAEPEPIAAEGEGEPSEPEGDESEVDKAAKRDAAFRAEIAKLRRELRERETRDAARYAPLPTAQPVQVEATPKKPAGVPVRVSEDGQSVYVDQAELDRLVEERAAQVVETKLRPTPEQMAAMEANRALESFVGENPERNLPVAQEAARAYQYLQLALKGAQHASGAVSHTADDLIAVARESGVAEQFAEFFPAFADHLDELIEADLANSPTWKSRLLRRIASEGNSEPTGIRNPAPVIPQRPVLRSVQGAPKSLARKGGDRSPAPSVKRQEFDALEREFRADIVFFPAEKRRRMEELGRELGVTGFV